MNKSLIALGAFALSALATPQLLAQQRPNPGGGGFGRPLASNRAAAIPARAPA